MNYCYFRVSGLVSTLENVCTTFGTHNAVKERLNAEINQTGEKLRIIVVKINVLLLFSCVWACLDNGKRVPCVLHAVRGALKRRNI